ncbi:hypothetical protein C84B14_11122 [Salinisphaera sp. C84B14]
MDVGHHPGGVIVEVQADTQHIDGILEPWQATIGRDYEGYRNHVVRMATFCLMLKPCSPQAQRRIEIAACFHDIGIWTADTLDYLEPSVPPALSYLDAHGLSDWGPEITEMILEHHRVREITHGLTPLVELFRKGDLVDFSKGIVRFGLPRRVVRDVMQTYPNAGFHRMLVKAAGKWFVRHPLNPMPMMKW